MNEPLTGGCQCGAVRYRITGPRPAVYACHCRECQKQSASAFGMSLPVRVEHFAVEGETGWWERGTDLGTRTRCYFCRVCGSRVYHQSSASDDRVTVKAGSLDDTGWLRPQAHLWVSRKQPWVVLDPDVPAHETQPSDLAAWRGAGPGELE
ncbi:GFA family protein [Sphingomonas gilva]|uniref:GFA family protein n=1 Tax=Sphingomonas gilva TaxID=2305907 RepID=A0A396RS26_9SPHN|nr:GFA family protein [Sphingomonas gilva]RHW17123.1 GFA family protein [Sphingomonas gilva]